MVIILKYSDMKVLKEATKMEVQNDLNHMNINEGTSIREINFDEDLNMLINSIAEDAGFYDHAIEKKMVSNVGGNYLGILFEVNIKGETKQGQKIINLFIKKIIKCDLMCLVSVPEAYAKEMFFYNDLVNIFERFQMEANIPTDEKFQTIKCFGVIKKPLSETLVLNNMTKQGFVTCNRLQVVSKSFAESCVINFAKFHALGYVLQEKNPEYFEKSKKLFTSPFNTDEKWVEFVRNVKSITLKRVKCNDLKKKLEDFIEYKIIPKFSQYYEPTKFSTLCHGDLKPDNILWKMNGKCTETLLLDYQLLYHGSPINDLVYFIVTGTDQEFRTKHLENLKTLYYRTLENFLKHFNMDVEKVYPKHEFVKDFKEKLEYGLMISIQFLVFLLAPEDEVLDMGEKEIKDMSLSDTNDTIFKERILGIIDDYVRWGYL